MDATGPCPKDPDPAAGFFAYHDDVTSQSDPAEEVGLSQRQTFGMQAFQAGLNAVLDTKSQARALESMHAVFYFLEQPDGGLANRVFSIFYSCLIIISVCGPILSTTSMAIDSRAQLQDMDVFFTTLFTIELAIKISCCPRRCAFLKSTYTFLDFFVVSAGYIHIIWRDSNNKWVELIATQVPILRLLKITRHSTGWRLLVQSIKQCLAPLLVPLYLMMLMVVFSGSLHFWIDGHFACGAELDEGKPVTCEAGTTPAFASIPEAMWFVLVTMTTVGYGDIVPHTNAGRALASMQIVAGICYMAMPLSIIGGIFMQVWSHRHRLLLQDKLGASGARLEDVKRIFESFDLDRSGAVDFNEFLPLIRGLNLGLSERTIREIFHDIDVDNSLSIRFEELADYLMFEV
ncbi:unnamed protein product [Polarella glacialis]|uniref:EF-hand domain-containing protein n=1 Tax=Polarella glacialis TaxID=89957 RepID=A0A813FGV0_POLGL|nr:unnamed protein product [Polarella glacialis]